MIHCYYLRMIVTIFCSYDYYLLLLLGMSVTLPLFTARIGAEDGHVGGPASLRHQRDQVLSSLSRGDRRGNSTNVWREDVGLSENRVYSQ